MSNNETDCASAIVATRPGRPRGRPKGSRNRPKPIGAVPVVKPAARIDSAAAYLDVSKSTMRRWVRRGVVSSTQIDNLILVSVASLDALLERGA
jgi:excisionase family DNA binding protein